MSDFKGRRLPARAATKRRHSASRGHAEGRITLIEGEGRASARPLFARERQGTSERKPRQGARLLFSRRFTFRGFRFLGCRRVAGVARVKLRGQIRTHFGPSMPIVFGGGVAASALPIVFAIRSNRRVSWSFLMLGLLSSSGAAAVAIPIASRHVHNQGFRRPQQFNRMGLMRLWKLRDASTSLDLLFCSTETW